MCTTATAAISKRPFVITVEGNIGAGKSTFLQKCSQDDQIEVLYERVSEWTNLQGTNLLANFYKNPKEYGLTFQTLVTLTMLKQHLKPINRPIKLMERSLSSARHCFVKSMVADGILSIPQSHVLNEWYEFIDHQFQDETKVDLIVYLSVDSDIAYDRLNKRQREGEQSVTLPYLERLEKFHTHWLEPKFLQYQLTEEGTPIYTINANNSVNEIWDNFRNYLGMWKHELDIIN